MILSKCNDHCFGHMHFSFSLDAKQKKIHFTFHNFTRSSIFDQPELQKRADRADQSVLIFG